MSHDPLLLIERIMPHEADQALHTFTTANPRWRGAHWADVLEAMADRDAYLDKTEPVADAYRHWVGRALPLTVDGEQIPLTVELVEAVALTLATIGVCNPTMVGLALLRRTDEHKVKGLRIGADGSLVALPELGLANLQAGVGGSIEPIPTSDDVTMWVHEDGKYLNPPQRNSLAMALWVWYDRYGCTEWDWLAGPCVVTGGVDAHGNTKRIPLAVLTKAVDVAGDFAIAEVLA